MISFVVPFENQLKKMDIWSKRIYACGACEGLFSKFLVKTVKLNPETTYQAIVGSVLVRIRKEMKIEQAELARAVGINQSTWSRIERGESALSVEQLFQAANFLRIKPSVVIQETESALQSLKGQDVVVSAAKDVDKRVAQGVALIGASALGALVGAAVMKSKQKKD